MRTIRLNTMAWRCTIAAYLSAGCAFAANLDTRNGVAWMLAALVLVVISLLYAEEHQQVKYGR